MSTLTITHSPVLSKTVFQSSWNADAYSSPLPEIGFLRLFDENVVGFGEAQNSTPRMFFDASAEKMTPYKTLDTTHATPSPEAATQTQYLITPPAPKLRSIPLPAFDDEEEDLFFSLGGGEPMEVDDAPLWPASVRGPSTSDTGHASMLDTESEVRAQGQMGELRNALALTHLSPHQTFGATF